MTEHQSPEENHSSDKKAATSAIQAPEASATKEKQSTSSAKAAASVPSKKPVTPPSNKLSKTAVVALIIAIASGAGVGGLHYLHTLEMNKQQQATLAQMAKVNQQQEELVSELLLHQQETLEKQVNNALQVAGQNNQNLIKQLEQQIRRFEQNQPSDWLIHEAEYLVRIASRTIWLEQDTAAAISLLKDADARIKELADPQYLPVRQQIKEDIAALSLMPTIESEEIILSLMGLSKQIPSLQLAMANKPEAIEQADNLELTDSPADWQENLKKTWRKFMADFITVRRRSGEVEPLMSPQHQQNLKENLSLKLQQAQWAVSEKNGELFIKTLDDIQSWLSSYFDLSKLETAKFYQSIGLLKNELVSYDFPNQLSSHRAIRQILSQQTAPTLEQPAEQSTQDQEVSQPVKAEEKTPAPSSTETREDA